MPVKDRENFYDGLASAAPPTTTPNTVSRSVKVGDRSFLTVVIQSGKPVLDSEIQLQQDVQQFAQGLLNHWQAPSGWLRGQTRHDVYQDYTLGVDPVPLADIPALLRNADLTLINSFVLPRLTAHVAGMPVVVEYTNTSSTGYNLVELEVPTVYAGPAAVKRTDFVFLEVWKALVAPSVPDTGTLVVLDYTDIVGGVDTFTVGGVTLTAVAQPGPAVPGEFLIGTSNDDTATNIAAAINDPANLLNTLVIAYAYADTVVIQAIVPGVTAVPIVLAASSLGLVASGVALVGGEDRPNKPNQSQLYRHGNTQSPSATWLDDELVDPLVNMESTQRVQVQYRIRATGNTEEVNYKTHPDGFSARSGGNLTIFARGSLATPDASYPFVPADKSSSELSSSAVLYDREDPGLWIAGDGSETAAQDLGAVDGFVYAIPLCFVHRHDDVSDVAAVLYGFDPAINTNGAPVYDHGGYVGVFGAIAAGLSDRPDGHFADVVSQDNLLDLRRHVSFSGVDTAAELQFQIQSLLDGSTRTWSVDAASKQTLGNGTGDVSTQFLVCNAIGRRDGAHGGTGATTTSGDFIREFDHVARRFGDQSVTERVVFAFYPGDVPVGLPTAPGLTNPGKYVVSGGGTPGLWYAGDTLHLDLANLDATTLGGIFQGLDGGGSSGGPLTIADCMPAGTVITDVLSVKHDDGYSVAAVSQDVQVGVILGLGTQHVELTLDTNPTVVDGGVAGDPTYPMVGAGMVLTGSPNRIFLEVEITYPIGEGATDTVYHQVSPDGTVYAWDPAAVAGPGAGPGPVVEDEVSERPNDMDTLLAPRFREGYREIQLEYQGNDTTGQAALDKLPGVAVGVTAGHEEYIVSADTTTLYFPRRVLDDAATTVYDEAFPAVPLTPDSGLTEWGSSSRKVVMPAPLSNAGQTRCRIEYFAQDPIPNYGGDGYQVNTYFRTNAPQTAGVVEGNIYTTLGTGVVPMVVQVEPLCMSSDVWTGQVGSGSLDRAYPYVAPLDQIPVNDGVVPAIPEWYFCGTADVTIEGFNAETGLLALRPFVQADGQNILSFGGADAAERPRVDSDFRAYYPWADDTTYRPTVLSQPLYGAVRHKVLYPFLARAVADVPGTDGGLLYRKDELLLVVLTRFAGLDSENNVRFVDPIGDNTTCAAIYRTRNLLLLVGGRA